MRAIIRLRSLLVLGAALGSGACSTPSGADVTDVTDAAIEASSDTGATDVQDVTVADITDVSDVVTAPDATDASDATADAAPDAPAVSFQAMVHITLQGQNCQPAVAPDPMTLTGTLDVDNFGALDIGPITASEGIFVLPDGTELARFAFAPVTIPAVAHGASGHASFTKTAGSLVPATGCSAVPCGSVLRLAVPISGTNVPAGTRAASVISTIGCVH